MGREKAVTYRCGFRPASATSEKAAHTAQRFLSSLRGLVFQGKEAQPQARLDRRPTVKPLAMGQRCDPRRCAPRWRQWPFGRVQDPKVRSDRFGLRSTTPQPTRLTSNASPRTFAAKASFAGRSMLRIRSVRSWVSQKASFPRDRSREVATSDPATPNLTSQRGSLVQRRAAGVSRSSRGPPRRFAS